MGAQKAAQTFLNEVSRLKMRMKMRLKWGWKRWHKAWLAAYLKCAPSNRLNLVNLQIRWEKNITLGEPPGFLHSWWWWVWLIAIAVFTITTIMTMTITILSQCILGLILRCSWKKRDLRPQQWGKGIPWLCKSHPSWWYLSWIPDNFYDGYLTLFVILTMYMTMTMLERLVLTDHDLQV